MATKKNTKVNDSVNDSINDSAVSATADDDFAVDMGKVEDNDTLVEQESDAAVRVCPRKPPTIRVKRVENKDLEATLQEVGYENVAQILVEPSLGFALFNIIYWESNNED